MVTLIKRQWHRTARGRLKFELAGVAFARKKGFTPEDYANHLWSTGAVKWMGKAKPTAEEYLLKEAEAFRILYPEVVFTVAKLSDHEAELIFTSGGCLGGWGKKQWAMAQSLGIGKGHVCRYCRQAFRTWAKQLGIQACPEPQTGGTCILRVSAKPEEQ
ncbi:MAG: hypothetical protein HYY41_03250 [Chloroflexi bacterium]|nr:hypothetical protein [Chloroflexota bacterium]MBI2979827.1 hypothetical protein [Chloroflexota bacterium]